MRPAGLWRKRVSLLRTLQLNLISASHPWIIVTGGGKEKILIFWTINGKVLMQFAINFAKMFLQKWIFSMIFFANCKNSFCKNFAKLQKSVPRSAKIDTEFLQNSCKNPLFLQGFKWFCKKYCKIAKNFLQRSCKICKLQIAIYNISFCNFANSLRSCKDCKN